MQKNQKTLIWSNSLNNNQNLKQYHASISQHINMLKDYGIHVFLNRCIPIQANDSFFKSVNCVFIGRQCSAKYDRHSMHGGSFLLANAKMFSEAYVCNNDFSIYKIDLDNFVKTKQNIQNSIMYKTIVSISSNASVDFSNTKYGYTTGFAAYLFMLQFTDKIALCNFGVKDKEFSHSSTMHSIIDEDKWFNSHNVERICI